MKLIRKTGLYSEVLFHLNQIKAKVIKKELKDP